MASAVAYIEPKLIVVIYTLTEDSDSDSDLDSDLVGDWMLENIDMVN